MASSQQKASTGLAFSMFDLSHHNSNNSYTNDTYGPTSPRERKELLLALGVMSLLVALFAIVQIVRMLISRCRSSSYQTAFLGLCGVTSILRGVFLLCTAQHHKNSILFFFTNDFPLALQLATFSLLVIYFSSCLSPVSHTKITILWLCLSVATIIALYLLFEVHCNREWKCLNHSVLWNLVYAIVYLILCIFLAGYGGALALKMRHQPRMLPSELQHKWWGNMMLVVFLVCLSFCSRGLYDLIVFAGKWHISEDTFELPSFLLLCFWDIAPTLLVLLFFVEIPKPRNSASKWLQEHTPPMLTTTQTPLLYAEYEPSSSQPPTPSTNQTSPNKNSGGLTVVISSQRQQFSPPAPRPKQQGTPSRQNNDTTPTSASSHTGVSPPSSSLLGAAFRPTARLRTISLLGARNATTNSTPPQAAVANRNENSATITTMQPRSLDDISALLRTFDNNSVTLGDGIVSSWQPTDHPLVIGVQPNQPGIIQQRSEPSQPVSFIAYFDSTRQASIGSPDSESAV